MNFVIFVTSVVKNHRSRAYRRTIRTCASLVINLLFRFLTNKKMRHIQTIFIIGLIASSCISSLAGELTNPEVQGWRSKSIPTPDSTRDYSPHSRLVLPEDQQFLIVQARFNIDWTDSENEKEEIEYNYSNIHLDLTDGMQISPIATITPDGRVDTFSKAERKDIKAREDWGAEELRWGAVFILPNKQYNEGVLTFVDQSYPFKFDATPIPHAAESIRVKVDSTEWLKSRTSEAGAEDRIPSASIQLEFEGTGLLTVDLTVNALRPNVIGGENRMIFRPSDFTLRTAQGSIEPVGILGNRSQIIRSTIFNISRRSLNELPKAESKLSLLFKVPDDFQNGHLEYFGKTVAETSAPSD